MSENSPAAPSKSAPAIKGIIDQKYEILGLLGQGGMGAVYRARHLMLNKDVALKTFKSANLSSEDMRRFHREAQAIAKLTHVNVIQVYDYGLTENGLPYYTMEYLTGESMIDRVRREGFIAPEIAVPFFVEVCAGLALAHGKGIVHRDLKPGNIFIEKTGAKKGPAETVKIVDFGIASLSGQTGLDKITISGTIFGSPLYMSPEQASGQPVTPRSDIYSLGCSMFEVLTGRPPFFGASPLETIIMHRNERAPSLAEACGKEFPLHLERAVATMLAKVPEKRQQHMQQVAAELSDIYPPDNKPRRFRTAEFIKRPAPSASNLYGLSNMPGAPSEAESANTSVAEDEDTPPKNALLSSAVVSAIVVALVVIGAGVGAVWMIGKNQQTAPVSAERRSTLNETVKPVSQLPRKGGKVAVSRSVETGADGKERLVFEFPSDQNYGRFYEAYPRSGQKINIEARGRVSWPKEKELSFFPTDEFAGDPSNFDVFAPDDIACLEMSRCPEDVNSEFLQKTSRLIGLRILNIAAGEVSNGDVPTIGLLPKLRVLNVSNTAITGAGLAKLPTLKNLHRIYFARCQDVTPLLQALQGGSVDSLDLAENDLSPEDFVLISKMKTVSYLHVPHANVDDRALVLISTLPRLRYLYCQQNEFTDASMEPLKKIIARGLHTLDISESKMPLQVSNTVKRLFPKAKVPTDHVYDPDWTDLGKHPAAQYGNLDR